MFRLQQRPALSTSVSSILVAGILWAVALAALPHLHEEIHHDAGEPDHDCAVTLFQQGVLEGAPAPAFLAAPIFREIPEVDRMHSAEVAAIFLLNGVMEHAPPFFPEV